MGMSYALPTSDNNEVSEGTFVTILVNNTSKVVEVPLIQLPSKSDITKPEFVDPVLSEVSKLTAIGMNDSTIVAEFAKQGIIYYPATKDWAVGQYATPEQMKYWARAEPTLNNSTMSSMSMTPMDITYDHDDLGTVCHYITTHIGNGAYGCFEIGVWNYPPGNKYVVYTYSQNDGDDGPVVTQYYPSPSAFYRYTIFTTGVDDGSGYPYYASFDSTVIRMVHMGSLDNQISQCNEAFKYHSLVPTTFTPDTSRAVFKWQYVVDKMISVPPGGILVPVPDIWYTNIADRTGTPYATSPQHYARTPEAFPGTTTNSWRFETWLG